MVGLSACELKPETLRAGETVEYFSYQFVSGDPRGHRAAKVLKVARGDDHPIQVDTLEAIPLTMMIRRIVAVDGRKLQVGESKWRKLRTYTLESAVYEAPTRFQQIGAAVRAINASALLTETSTCAPRTLELRSPGCDPREVIDLTSPQRVTSSAGPPPLLQLDSGRHGVSGMDENTLVCGADSGRQKTTFLHPTAKAPEMDTGPKFLLAIPGPPGASFFRPDLNETSVSTALRSIWVPRNSSNSVLWPMWVDLIERNLNLSNIRFPEVKLGYCRCVCDCLPLRCWNAVSGVYCTTENCGVGEGCSNRIRSNPKVELFETAKGLSVRTTDWMSSWEIVGEYSGLLTTSLDSVRGSHYALMMSTLRSGGDTAFIDASRCGGLTRHVNHSCSPNSRFVEVSNGAECRVIIVTTRCIAPQEELTVRYTDNSLWFTCLCGEADCIHR